MGKGSSQLTGHKYFATFLAKIGHAIEGIVALNIEEKGWMPIVPPPMPFAPAGTYTFNQQNVFGEQGGSFAGQISVYTGSSDQLPHDKYVAHYPLASGYPFESYLFFHGDKGFEIGNSGTMPEVQYRVKRIHKKADDTVQWYDEKAEIANQEKKQVDFADDILDDRTYTLVNAKKTRIDFAGNEHKTEDNDLRIYFSKRAGFEYNAKNRVNAGAYGGSGVVGRGGAAEIEYKFNMGDLTGLFEFTIKYELCGDRADDITTTNGIIKEESQSSQYLKDYSNTIYEERTVVKTIMFEGAGGFVIINAAVERDDDHTSYYATALITAKYLGSEPAELNNSGDMNPIHIIRELLTDDIALNKPESLINDANFMRAADVIFDEGLGVSKRVENAKCTDLIQELCQHIEAGVRINRHTGLYEVVLFRDDWFADEDIHALDKKFVKNLVTEPLNIDEIVNKINAKYYDRSNTKEGSFAVVNDAAVLEAGKENAIDVDLTWFANQRNANISANIKLKNNGTPTHKGSFSTGHRSARKWNKYDLLKLQIDNEIVTVRLLKITLGDGKDNSTSVEFVEVVPSGNYLQTTVVESESNREEVLPAQQCDFEVFEAPYFHLVMNQGQRTVEDELAFDSDYGILTAIAEKPQFNSLNAILEVYRDAEWQRAAAVSYCDTAKLDQAIDRMQHQFVIRDFKATATKIGTLIKLGDEWLSFVAFDAVTKVLTVKRGVHSVPITHALNEKLWFCGANLNADAFEYNAGQRIPARVLTATPSGISDNIEKIVDFNSVAYRPYPPANVKICGEYWPTLIDSDLEITWSHRNRMQQTSATEIVGWYDNSVTLESAVTYTLILTELDKNEIELRTQNINVATLDNYRFAASSMDANTHYIEIVLKAVRDGYECLYSFNHTVTRLTLVAPTNVTFEAIEY